MQSGGVTSSSMRKDSFLAPRPRGPPRSRAAPRQRLGLGVVAIRSRITGTCSSGSVPFLTIRPRFFWIVCRARSSASGTMSISTTGYPVWASTCAMPLPIVPDRRRRTFRFLSIDPALPERSLSTESATALPPPRQRVASPASPPRSLRACSRVTRIRAPLAPIGCPRATAPPWTLTRDQSQPSSFPSTSAWAANASFASMRS